MVFPTFHIVSFNLRTDSVLDAASAWRDPVNRVPVPKHNHVLAAIPAAEALVVLPATR